MSRLERMRRDDGGWAMVVVLGTMLTLSLLVALALTSASRALATSRHGQDSLTALSAAQAGVQHFLDQLNRNSTYYLKTAPDPANPALRADASDPSVRVSVATRSVTTGPEPSFRYQVLSTQAQVTSTGRVVVKSVGRSRGVERTVQVSFTNDSIFKYLYYTEFETLPPSVAGSNPDDCTKLSHDQHGETSPRLPADCPEVSFGGDATFTDRVYGTVHTEDRITINGSPEFYGPVETGWDDPAGAFFVKADKAATATPRFFAGTPTHVDFPFPKYNRELRQEAVDRGCVYTGPTRIRFLATGRMSVTLSPGGTASGTGCGTFTSTVRTQEVPVRSNGVVWVDKLPVTAPACTIDDQRAALGFPVAGDDALIGVSPSLGHDCRSASVYVEGWVSGQTTLGSEDNVFVTGNLRYAAGMGTAVGALHDPDPSVTGDEVPLDVRTGSDVLGLYANTGYVAVYHPGTCGSSERNPRNAMCKGYKGSEISLAAAPPNRPTKYPMTEVQIDAAIVTPQAFLVANHDLGSAAQSGTRVLHLVGSIAQRFRGAVAVSSSSLGVRGFTKDYRYDPRLKSVPPPHLADVTATAWGVSQFAETG